MKPSDLAEDLDQDPVLEYPLGGSGDPSPPAVPPAGGRGDASPPSQAGTAGRVLEDPEPQPQPTRFTKAERDAHVREVLQMVMDIFPGARWTTKAEYQQAATRRDRQGRRRRG
jgi:hypothetical protein